jgi:hypothetical protein
MQHQQRSRPRAISGWRHFVQHAFDLAAIAGDRPGFAFLALDTGCLELNHGVQRLAAIARLRTSAPPPTLSSDDTSQSAKIFWPGAK